MSFEMKACGSSLIVPPAGPVERLLWRRKRVPDETIDQPSDLRDCHRQESGVQLSPFSESAASLERTTAREISASIMAS